MALKGDLKAQYLSIQQTLKDYAMEFPAIEWQLNPSFSPRYSGHTEAVVKLCRHSLNKILPISGLLNDEDFTTLVKKCQAFLNMRPLSEPSPDPRDPRPLTPADFLLTGSRHLELMPTTPDPEVVPLARHIREAQAQLWQAYFTEYVKTLAKFVKNSQSKPYQYEEGEFVHLLKAGTPIAANAKTMAGEYRGVSGRYHIGRIVQIHPGDDGIGRNFVVDTGVEGKPLKTMSYMCIAPLFI